MHGLDDLERERAFRVGGGISMHDATQPLLLAFAHVLTCLPGVTYVFDVCMALARGTYHDNNDRIYARRIYFR